MRRPPVRTATTTTLLMPALPRAITGLDIFTMEFSWELDPGPIGATTMDGAAIAFADPVEATIIRTVDTIRDIHRMEATRHITGRRFRVNLHITAGNHRITVANHLITETNHRTTEDGRQITVANHPMAAVAANLPAVEEVVEVVSPQEAEAVNLLAVAEGAADHRVANNSHSLRG